MNRILPVLLSLVVFAPGCAKKETASQAPPPIITSLTISTLAGRGRTPTKARSPGLGATDTSSLPRL